MDWLTRLERLSHHELKNLAFLSGGMAALMLAALGISGNLPGLPDYLNLALRANTGSANTAAVYNWINQTNAGSRAWVGVTSSADGMRLAGAVGPGYIYTSIDGGVNWEERTGAGSASWMDIVSSADGMKIVGLVSSGIYISTDGGTTWTSKSLPNAPQTITSSADGMKLATAKDGGSIYTSIDGGTTWVQRPAAGTRRWNDITSSADGTQLAAVVGNSNGYIYTSADGGLTWTEQTGSGLRSWKYIASSADGQKLIAGALSENRVYTSTNGGVTWSPSSILGTPEGVASSADGSKLVVAGGTFIYVSTDGGATWKVQPPVGSPTNWRHAASSADGRKFVVATGASGPIFTSAIAGSCSFVWTEQEDPGLQAWVGIASSFDGSKLAAADFGGYIYTSVNSGSDWTEQTGSGARDWASNHSITSSADGTRLAVAVNGGSLYTSSNSGATWATSTTAAGSFANWTGIASSADGMKLAALERGDYIHTSTDGGSNWTQRTSAGRRSWFGITSSSDGTKLAAIVNAGFIYTSSDSGVTWATSTAIGSKDWFSIASSADGTKLIAVSVGSPPGGYVYTSSDSGATWATSTSAGQRFWFAVTSSANGMTLAATVNNGGVYTSRDGGATWTLESVPAWTSIASSYDGNKLAATDYAGYIYTATCNYAPDAPLVSGPSTGQFNSSYTFTATSTDFDGDQLRYGFDWDNDGSIDEWAPSVGYVDSNTARSVSHSWATSYAGPRVFGVFAEDENGNISAATYAQIVMQLTGSPTGTITGAANCSAAVGTATDPSGGGAVQVGIYMDGPWDSGGEAGVFLASTTATGGVFNVSLLAFPSLQDGYTHTLFAYARNNPSTTGIDAVLTGSPFSCTAPPPVTITKTKDAKEGSSSTNGAFLVARTGSTTSALTVNFTTDGTAAPGGVDFQNFGTSVVISAGASSATITVPPRTNNATVQGSKTLIINLSSSASYGLGTPASATMSITDDDLTPPSVSQILLTASRVRKGNVATLSWNIGGMYSGINCSLTPTLALPTWNGFSPWTGNVTTPAINVATKYTLSCGNGSATTSRSTTINLVPTSVEL